ncbi:MAG: nucleoside deaminase [Planctomycetes bacterium]|nr:nucleoside deaminase [Planctomycetota bacterium]
MTHPELTRADLRCLAEALAEARRGLAEGGIPIGSVLAVGGRILGRGHNRRVQEGNPILHGEMAALQDAGRQPARAYRRATLYTTLSPCDMCTGAILLYRIPRVVIAERRTFRGPEALLRRRGVQVVVADLPEAVALLREFVAAHPGLWCEDIGETAAARRKGRRARATVATRRRPVRS